MKTYDTIGLTYRSERRPDPRIAGKISGKLSGIKTVLNIGAGTGSKRMSISSLALNANAEGLVRLGRELVSGEWENKYGGLSKETELDIGYRLVVADKLD
jgi:hypothetical protein